VVVNADFRPGGPPGGRFRRIEHIHRIEPLVRAGYQHPRWRCDENRGCVWGSSARELTVRPLCRRGRPPQVFEPLINLGTFCGREENSWQTNRRPAPPRL
jgi:hypothetical protein